MIIKIDTDNNKYMIIVIIYYDDNNYIVMIKRKIDAKSKLMKL